MIRTMSPRQRRRAYLLLGILLTLCLAWFVGCVVYLGWPLALFTLALALWAVYGGRIGRKRGVA